MKRKDGLSLYLNKTYKIDPVLKEKITFEESAEDIDDYFLFLERCKKINICSRCYKHVDFSEEVNPEYENEFKISGLCKKCQIEIFGV